MLTCSERYLCSHYAAFRRQTGNNQAHCALVADNLEVLVAEMAADLGYTPAGYAPGKWFVESNTRAQYCKVGCGKTVA
eukprot:SAG22_NODE_21610_length_255_cov_1.326923_1_plen_77_part_01